MTADAFKYSDAGRLLNALPFWARIALHDCIVHPLAGLLWIVGADAPAYWLHRKTAPMLCRKCARRFDAEICPICKTELS